MSCARCTMCAIQFPGTMTGLCPVCNAATLEYVPNREEGPDEDFQDRINQADFERYYEKTRGLPA